GAAGDARKAPLRERDADVLEVVHARAVHADQIVAVGSVPRRRLRVRRRGHAHRLHPSPWGGAVAAAVPCLPDRRRRPGRPGPDRAGVHRSWSSPRTLPSGAAKVATRRPPPTSRGGSFTLAPAAVTSASFASMSGTCQ